MRLARYPVFPRRLASAHGEDWFAVGDAALAFDPVSGQGISFAIETAFRAAEMACSSAPLTKLGPLYDEALRSRWLDHRDRRLDVYREAAPRFPGRGVLVGVLRVLRYERLFGEGPVHEASTAEAVDGAASVRQKQSRLAVPHPGDELFQETLQ